MAFSIGDVQMRAKWILLSKGLAATPYLQGQVKANRGAFVNSVRTYRLPTEDEEIEALGQALKELTE